MADCKSCCEPLVLHYSHGCEKAYRILITCRILGIKLVEKVICPGEKFSRKGASSPYIEFPCGTPHFQNNAILRTLARLKTESTTKLYGKTPTDATLVDQHLEFLRSEVEQHSNNVIYGILGHFPYDKKTFSTSANALFTRLKVIDANLAKKTFLVGDSITIADIALVGTCLNLFRFHLHQGKRKQLPNLTAFMEARLAEKHFADVIGKVWFCNKELKPVETERPKKKQKKQKPKKEK